MADDLDELITTERVGFIAWTLAHWPYERKPPPTDADLAALVGITENGMGRMLRKLARVLPIYAEHGGWYVVKVPNWHEEDDKVGI